LPACTPGEFRADTHVQDVQLPGVLPAIEHPGFPVDELHWDTLYRRNHDGDMERGHSNILGLAGTMEWLSPDTVAVGPHPCGMATGDIRYRYDPQTLTVNGGEFENAREPGVRAEYSRRGIPRWTCGLKLGRWKAIAISSTRCAMCGRIPKDPIKVITGGRAMGWKNQRAVRRADVLRGSTGRGRAL